MNIIKVCFILMAVALFAVACGQTATTPNAVNSGTNANKPTNAAAPQTPAPADESAMARDLYAVNCMTCHKDSGKGGKMTFEGKKINPDDLTSAKIAAFSDEKTLGYIVNGVEDEGMPAFKGKLTDEQMKLIVKHLRSLQKS